VHTRSDLWWPVPAIPGTTQQQQQHHHLLALAAPPAAPSPTTCPQRAWPWGTSASPGATKRLGSVPVTSQPSDVCSSLETGGCLCSVQFNAASQEAHAGNDGV